jgi:hypothetical protein
LELFSIKKIKKIITMQEGNPNIISIIQKTNKMQKKHFKLINTGRQNTNSWEERITPKRNGGDRMELMDQ